MADATYLNNVEARRIHKSNAREVVEEADDSWQMLRDYTIALKGASCPTIPPLVWLHEVDDILAEAKRAAVDGFKAQYILDYPDDCEDELECKSDA